MFTDLTIAIGRNVGGIDWPVSGDETRLAYGYRMARSHRVTSIWERPGVRPMGETYGIDSHGIETPWNIDDVLHVTS